MNECKGCEHERMRVLGMVSGYVPHTHGVPKPPPLKAPGRLGLLSPPLERYLLILIVAAALAMLGIPAVAILTEAPPRRCERVVERDEWWTTPSGELRRVHRVTCVEWATP